jgi:two-component system response regulator PilR (NtrC family)
MSEHSAWRKTEPVRPLQRLPRVLCVDDEVDLRELLALTMVRMGLDVDTAASVDEARRLLAQHRYGLCLTDMRLPDGSGLELVRELAVSGGPPVAVITAYGSAETAVAALKGGAFDYLTKPVDLDQLRLLVRAALRPAAETPAAATASGPAALARLIGYSAAMVQLRARIERLAHSMAPVAIYGESGSGKELVARAIHACSARAAQPFVAVNCGAIPDALMEAEFFGYRKGAFTGAERDREGFFQAAAGGTLFLDEVAELPLPMQVKLLRAIQERRVRRVGATAEEPTDVRLISATNQDLGQQVTAGRFRQDLFYRLNVIELRVPPLRERSDDLVPIADAILQRLARDAGVEPSRLSPAAVQALLRHSFPGNVRELENILERAVALAAEPELRPSDLMLPVGDGELAAETENVVPVPAPAPVAYTVNDGVPSDLGAYLDALEREAIRAALAKTGHNRTAAAPLLGLSFRQLRYRMQRLGLK